jgi:hypothetical protein
MSPTDSIEDQIRDLFTTQATAVTAEQVAAVATGTYSGRKRHTGSLALTGFAVAAAAAAAAVLLSSTGTDHDTKHPGAAANSPQTANSTAPATSSIVLAGYRVTLPATYKLGQADTNCAAELHLSPGEAKRLITTPAATCPLLINSVASSLPPGAEKIVTVARANGGSADLYVGGTPATIYLPAKLADATTVYVTLRKWQTTTGTVQITFDSALVTQLVNLEHGLQVTAD